MVENLQLTSLKEPGISPISFRGPQQENKLPPVHALVWGQIFLDPNRTAHEIPGEAVEAISKHLS